MTTMDTIVMLASNISDDDVFGRVVRALLVSQEVQPVKPEIANSVSVQEPLRLFTSQEPLRLFTSPEPTGRSHGKTFDAEFGAALAAAVRAHGGRVEWTSRYIKENVPGYRGDTARAIGNAMGQWHRAWVASKTTFYGLRVVDVRFTTRVDDRASATYTIECASVDKAR